MDFHWGEIFNFYDTAEEVLPIFEASSPAVNTVPVPVENLSPEELQHLGMKELSSSPEQCGEANLPDFDYFPELWGDTEARIQTQECTLQAVPNQPMQLFNVENLDFQVGYKVLGYVDELNQPSQPAEKKPRTKNLKRFTSQWNCEECKRAFKSKGGLSQHKEKIHSGPTPHRCDICGKRYRDLGSMEQHRQRHLLKDKPFKCSECPKQFIGRSDLQRHVGLHHGVSPHRCDICGKAFDRADHLTEHKWSHENGTVKKFKASRPQ